MKRFYKQHLLTILCIVLIVINSRADSITVSGIVSGNWNTDTVFVMGDLEIREVGVLNIEPGVLVLFQGQYTFKVNGCLKALGAEGDLIYFTMADTTGFYNDTIPDGGWKSIRIENTSPTVDSIIFSYCHFSFGKALSADSVHSYGGAICARKANKLRISNCIFQNNYSYFNGGAVFLEQTDALVEYNKFTGNKAGIGWNYYGYGGGLCTDWGEPVIRNNSFYQNSSTGIAGGLCVRFKDGLVYNNIFDNNFSALGGGFGILHIDTCHHTIANNLVINNGATFFGAGISNNDCSPTYVNNTIANNHCQGGGGGFYCKDSVVPNLYNNILYGNTQYGGQINQVYLWDLLAQPNFYYNDIEGGWEAFEGTGGSAFSGDFENNIDMDPLFESNGSFEYMLNFESPGIDAGTSETSGFGLPQYDLTGNPRIVNDKIDIGAIENQSSVGTNELIEEIDAIFYPPSPNPASYHLKLKFYLLQDSDVKLTLIDGMGKTIKLLVDGRLDAGLQHVAWNVANNIGSLVSPGVYIAILKAGDKSYHQKIIIN